MLAGATMPNQIVTSYPGTPASAMVDVSGNTVERSEISTASARTRLR